MPSLEDIAHFALSSNDRVTVRGDTSIAGVATALETELVVEKRTEMCDVGDMSDLPHSMPAKHLHSSTVTIQSHSISVRISRKYRAWRIPGLTFNPLRPRTRHVNATAQRIERRNNEHAGKYLSESFVYLQSPSLTMVALRTCKQSYLTSVLIRRKVSNRTDSVQFPIVLETRCKLFIALKAKRKALNTRKQLFFCFKKGKKHDLTWPSDEFSKKTFRVWIWVMPIQTIILGIICIGL